MKSTKRWELTQGAERVGVFRSEVAALQKVLTLPTGRYDLMELERDPDGIFAHYVGENKHYEITVYLDEIGQVVCKLCVQKFGNLP